MGEVDRYGGGGERQLLSIMIGSSKGPASAGILGDMWSMNLATMRWTMNMPVDPLEPRYGFGFVYWSGKLYMSSGFGGFNSSNPGDSLDFRRLSDICPLHLL